MFVLCPASQSWGSVLNDIPCLLQRSRVYNIKIKYYIDLKMLWTNGW